MNPKVKEKIKKVQDWLTKVGREIYYFVSSGIFLKNFGGMVATVALVLSLSLWWINCYTKHGESLHIHDFVEMDLDDAIEKASNSSFEIVINDSIFIPGRAPNIILAQNPKPQSQVKKNRKIYVTVTKKIPELVELPSLKGGNDDYDNFKKKCERKYVQTEITKEVFSNKLEPYTILEVYFEEEEITTKLNEGFEVPKGSTIQCVITKRGGGTVPVPELICKKKEEADFLIGNFNLNIGSVIKDNTVTNEATAYVWRQVPRYSPSSKMRVGEQVDIYLTQFKPKNCGGGGVNIESPAPVEDPSDFDEEDEDFGG